jgi:MinD-like ATPase involved in chromosome partitioning or flagellar assembly
MGKIVTIWSNSKKCGKTLLLYNLSNIVAEYLPDIRILVLCVNMNHGNLMNLFGYSKEELALEDIVNYNISEDNEELDYLKILARKNNLYFLGSQNTTVNYANRNIEIYEKVIDDFKNKFDLVLVDASAGKNIALTNMIISKSDAVINVITQDIELLQSGEFVNNNDLAYVINFYRDIYPKTNEIANMYSIKNIYKLPSCNLLQELKNKNRLETYSQYESEYYLTVERLSFFIMETFKLKPVKEAVFQRHEREKRKSRKNALKSIFKFKKQKHSDSQSEESENEEITKTEAEGDNAND